jgi:hypothetical protein
MKKWKKILAVIILTLCIFPQVSLADTSVSASGGLCIAGFCLNSSYSSSGSGNGWAAGNLSRFGLPSGSIYNIISNILSWLLGIFGFLGIIDFFGSWDVTGI